MEDRVILHCDCNSFFASVEIACDPTLRGKPIAVCGNTEERRGIVLAKSEEAKKYGIVTAETVWSAKKKCPALVTVEPHFDRYVDFSNRVNAIYCSYTDLVEPFSIDESWLDVTGSRLLYGDGMTIAREIKERVKREVGITISIGVSFNKIMAKFGSDYKKPDAITEISRETMKTIVYPLPVEELMFIGKRTALALHECNIFTIADLARANPLLLAERFGKVSESMLAYARGEDDSPVLPWDSSHECKSISNGMTFRHDLTSEEEVRVGLDTLSGEIGAKLRKQKMRACTVGVTVKDAALHTYSHQTSLDYPSCSAREVSRVAFRLVLENWKAGREIRSLTITVATLVRDGENGDQIDFFGSTRDSAREKNENIEQAADGIRKKFGKNAVLPASVIESDIGE